MTKKTAIYDGLFIVLLTIICHLLFSKYGFNPTDEGFVLSSSNRVLHGQIPHVDFSSLRPLGYAFLHIPELLFSKNYVLLISRFVFWLEQILIAFLWIQIILKYTKTEISTFQKYALIIICFILNVHYFPCSVLHTIDGLLMCLIGINIIISEFKYNYIGFLFIGFAVLCKQNYFIFFPVILWLTGRKNLFKNMLFGILPLIIYIIFISYFDGFYQLTYQLFIHHEFIKIGILTYLKSNMFYAGIIMTLIILIIQNNSYKAFVSFILLLVCFYALATNRYHEKFGFLIFGATFGYLLIPIIHKQAAFVKLFIIAITLAWCVSISIGYNSPALFVGGCMTLMLFYLLTISKKFKSRLSYNLIILLLPILFLFNFIRKNNIYRDAPSSMLTYKLDNIVDGAYGIRTNINTFKVLVELNLLKKKFPELTVIPDFTACNILHSHLSKIGTEWANKTEIPNQKILQFVIKDLVKDTSYILLPKYNTAQMSIGFEDVPENKVKDFLLIQYIFSHYIKTEEYSYFDLYKKIQ